jgi:maleylacetate reductase
MDLTVASSFNAMAHAFEALWIPSSTPIARMYALEGIDWLTTGLVVIGADTETPSLQAVEALVQGAYFCALAFAITGPGLHHKICHVLGGRFNLPHAPMHTALLPHLLRFNRAALQPLHRRIAHALRARDCEEGLADLYRLTGAPHSLAQVGLSASDLPDAIEAVATTLPIDNPRPVTAEELAGLLAAAANSRAEVQ